jgi:ribosomal-protein-alanine N-acetyltransferase
MELVPIRQDGSIEATVDALPPEMSGVLEATVALYATGSFTPPWICYLALKDGTPVGTCGFKSVPVNGRVEIAYFTFPGHEGRGVATGMASRLLDLASRAAPSVIVAAQTLPERNPSHRILEKHGFTCLGTVEHPEDGIVLEWQRKPPVEFPRRNRNLRMVKLAHTAIWALFASAILALPFAASQGRLDIAAGLIALVAIEVLVLLLNRMRCPLTDVAARYTTDRRDNFDIYLPLWLARYNKQIFGTLFVAGMVYTLIQWRR